MDWLVKMSVLLASWVVIAIGGFLVLGEYQRMNQPTAADYAHPPAKPIEKVSDDLAGLYKMAGAAVGDKARLASYCDWIRERAAKNEPVADIAATCARHGV